MKPLPSLLVVVVLAAAVSSAQTAETAFQLAGRSFAPEGLAVMPDGAFLVSSVHLGTLIPHVPGTEDRGADGLAYADGALYVVQNGVAPHRVKRWRLPEDETRVVAADVLASAEGDDRLDEPTLAAVAGPWFYVVVASGWAHFDATGRLDVDAAPFPLILRVRR